MVNSANRQGQFARKVLRVRASRPWCRRLPAGPTVKAVYHCGGLGCGSPARTGHGGVGRGRGRAGHILGAADAGRHRAADLLCVCVGGGLTAATEPDVGQAVTPPVDTRTREGVLVSGGGKFACASSKASRLRSLRHSPIPFSLWPMMLPLCPKPTRRRLNTSTTTSWSHDLWTRPCPRSAAVAIPLFPARSARFMTEGKRRWDPTGLRKGAFPVTLERRPGRRGGGGGV